MIRRPPRSTLFPSPTLFRPRSSKFIGRNKIAATAAAVVLLTLIGGIIATAWQADRKSTRLNSSHANISYAVFCLKKNNHQRNPDLRRIYLTRVLRLGLV